MLIVLCAYCLMLKHWSVGLIGGQQSSVHRLHAGGTGERPHQPVVYTVHVVNVHAGQEPDWVSVHKVHHTNHALSYFLFRAVSSRIINAFWEMLDEANALSNTDLLLFSQLCGQSSLAGCRVIHRHVDLLLIRGRWLLVWISTVSVAGPVRLRLVKQRDVIRSGRFQTVSHLPPQQWNSALSPCHFFDNTLRFQRSIKTIYDRINTRVLFHS